MFNFDRYSAVQAMVESTEDGPKPALPKLFAKLITFAECCNQARGNVEFSHRARMSAGPRS